MSFRVPALNNGRTLDTFSFSGKTPVVREQFMIVARGFAMMGPMFFIILIGKL